MNRSAEAVEFYILEQMSNTLQVLQLNVGKRETTQLSLLNDDSLQDFSVLAISEPYSWRTNDNSVMVTPV